MALFNIGIGLFIANAGAIMAGLHRKLGVKLECRYCKWIEVYHRMFLIFLYEHLRMTFQLDGCNWRAMFLFMEMRSLLPFVCESRTIRFAEALLDKFACPCVRLDIFH